MINKPEQKIINIIRYAPVLFIIFLSALLYFFLSHEHKNNFQKEKQLLHDRYIIDEKKRIKNTIEKTIFNFLVQKERSTKQDLKNKIKAQVNNAHSIANNLYNKYKNTKSKNEIEDIIKEALRKITFFEKRGYFFIYEMKGKNILNAKFPNIEGLDLWDYKDAKGTLLIQEMNKILEKQDETFYEWYWRKFENSQKQYKKIGYFKKFEPFGWFIGTGEYIDDFTANFKQSILKHLANLKYKDGGYIFVFDTNGTILSNKHKSLIGTNVFKTTNPSLKRFKESFKKAIETDKGVFTKYKFSNKSGDVKIKQKISYIKKFEEWGWVIGTGFNIDNLHKSIEEREKLLLQKYENDLEKLFLTTIFLLVILLMISFTISAYIERTFYTYTKTLKDQKNKLLEAQHIALISEWELNIETMKAKWSDDIIKLFGLEKRPKDCCGPELLRKFMHEDDWDNFENSMANCIRTGKDHRAIYRILKSDSSIIWIDCRGKLNKETNTIMGTVQDITEIKQKEKILYQQSRMAAMGEMIGNIAHQWRQPLSVISMNAATLKASSKLGEKISNEEIENFSDSISDQSDYLSQTIDDFRNFFISDSEHIKNTDISLALNKAKNLIKDSFNSNDIVIIDKIAPCKAIINESTFIQALLNIFNNAKDVMTKNDIKPEDRFLFIDLNKKGNTIELTISDSGGGISENILPKIFEPYFTTKHESIGTGIGLYMTHEIITKHLKGEIEAKTITYEYKKRTLTGARFTITIPIN